MRVVLLGAPGAGKGTQAGIIKTALGVPVVSTGNLLRAAVSAHTALGEQVSELLAAGKLVPDRLVVSVIEEKLKEPEFQKGLIFDGFPRTVTQAEALERFAKVDFVISLEVADDVIENRMSGRRTCEHCHETFHITANPPRIDGVCDSCGGKLGIRNDDKPEVVRQRLTVYHRETEPVKEFYRRHGNLIEVDGTRSLELVSQEILDALGVSL